MTEEPTISEMVEMDGQVSQSHAKSLTTSPAADPIEKSSSVASVHCEEENQHFENDVTTSQQAIASTKYGSARSTPGYPLTLGELQLLRKPGDTVTTESGVEVRIVQDGNGKLLFESSQKSTTESPEGCISSSAGQSSRESSTSSNIPAQKKRTRGVTRLTSIDPKNIISPSDDDDDQPTAAGTPPTSSAPSSSYSLRNRKAKQNGLIYDLKYHPMDDSIRPTQAAKRRSAHGEEQPSSDDENGSFSVRADSDTDSDVNEEEVKKPEAVKKGKKRARHQSQSLEPTRRSSRRTADTKVLYDMSVHPQDQDLIVVSSDDDEDRSNPTTKRKRSSHSSSKSKGRTKTPHVTEISSDATDPDDEPLVSVEDSNKGPEPAPAGVPEIFIKSSSPLSFVATPPPSGIRRKEGVDVWLQAPGERYFRHDRGSWPTTPGLPFQIHVDSLEAHLEAEANAASPLSFDHDDKENEVTHPGLDETPNALDVFTVMSASQYRRTSEDSHALQERSLVNEAFFSEHHVASPYGLGGDGTQEEQNRNIVKISVSDAMSVLVSGEQLPRGPTVMDQADEIDSVLNLTSAIDADSVIGSDSTTC